MWAGDPDVTCRAGSGRGNFIFQRRAVQFSARFSASSFFPPPRQPFDTRPMQLQLACGEACSMLQSIRPAAIDDDVVSAAHFSTFTSMVAAGRRAGNGCVAIGWRVKKANIRVVRHFARVFGLCNPFIVYEALGLCACDVHRCVKAKSKCVLDW